ncbi:hypothetical protein [Bacillus cereus group sp. BfR-BA-01382]|uniref:hypothetical protein n=1 Tax=Bacillus cereus group sp. BfR-BA-01382 TaxID=2920326 RepID=UPI001F588832
MIVTQVLLLLAITYALITVLFIISPVAGIIFLIMIPIAGIVFIHKCRKDEFEELKGLIAHNLSISQEEMLFDVERMKKSFLGWEKLYVFTSKGEFEVNIHRDDGEWVGIDLISISHVDYMKELNY